MKTFIRLFLLSFLLFWSSIANSSSIETDFKKTVQMMTKCAGPMMSFISQLPPDLIVLMMGDQFIPSNFTPSNNKQRKLKKVLDSQNMLIADAHKKTVINLLDFNSGTVCKRKMPSYSNKFFIDVTKKAEIERSGLINKIQNDQASYKDISRMIAADQEIMQELLMYWMQKEPEAMAKVEQIFEQNASLGNEMLNASRKMAKILENEFGIK